MLRRSYSKGVVSALLWVAAKPALIQQINIMLKLAIILLIVGLIAAALGLGGLGGIIMNVGWVLLVVALILIVVHFVGRKV